MKMKSLGLILLTMIITDSCIHAARRPSKAGAPSMHTQSKEVHEKLPELLTEIAGANIAQVKMLLEQEDIKKILNEHDGTFSPLGKVDDELEKNKRSSLAKPEKTARAKALNKIKELLQAHGATLVFRSAEPVQKRRSRACKPCVDKAL